MIAGQSCGTAFQYAGCRSHCSNHKFECRLCFSSDGSWLNTTYNRDFTVYSLHRREQIGLGYYETQFVIICEKNRRRKISAFSVLMCMTGSRNSLVILYSRKPAIICDDGKTALSRLERRTPLIWPMIQNVWLAERKHAFSLFNDFILLRTPNCEFCLTDERQ
jgi:hypothetical protein